MHCFTSSSASAADLRRIFSGVTVLSPVEICVDRGGRVCFASGRMEATPIFRELVDAHYEGLYRFGLSLARQSTAAEDLVQQTFLQWARKGHTLRDGTKAKTWLFTTLYREWLNIRRREGRVEVVEFNPEVHDGGEAMDTEEINTEDSALVVEALQRLDDTYRAPLVLFYMKEMAYKDIAEVLEIPIGTVMSRLSRGKDMLRKSLRSAMQGDGTLRNVASSSFTTQKTT